METNPYLPPNAPLDPSPSAIQGASEGRLLPYEDKAGHPGFGDRVMSTFRVFWTDPSWAGEGLGGSILVGPAIGFYALVGLPAAILAGALNLVWPAQPWFLSTLGMPKPAAPQGAAMIAGLFGVLLAPIFIAIAFALMGLLYHGGLWMVGGLKAGLGLPATYRFLLYSSAALAVPIAVADLALSRLPGPLHVLGIVVTTGAQLGIFFYQGAIFARTHRTDTWRGVLGMLMPLIVFGLVCGGCVGILWVAGGDAFREGLQRGLQGGS